MNIVKLYTKCVGHIGLIVLPVAKVLHYITLNLLNQQPQ